MEALLAAAQATQRVHTHTHTHTHQLAGMAAPATAAAPPVRSVTGPDGVSYTIPSCRLMLRSAGQTCCFVDAGPHRLPPTGPSFVLMGLQYFPAPKNSFEFVLLMTAESAAAGTKVAVCLENTNTYQPMLAGQGLLMRNGQRIRVNQFEIEVLDVRIKQTGPTPVLSKGLTSSLVESGLFASLGIDSDAIGDQLEGLTGSDLQLLLLDSDSAADTAARLGGARGGVAASTAIAAAAGAGAGAAAPRAAATGGGGGGGGGGKRATRGRGGKSKKTNPNKECLKVGCSGPGYAKVPSMLCRDGAIPNAPVCSPCYVFLRRHFGVDKTKKHKECAAGRIQAKCLDCLRGFVDGGVGFKYDVVPREIIEYEQKVRAAAAAAAAPPAATRAAAATATAPVAPVAAATAPAHARAAAPAAQGGAGGQAGVTARPQSLGFSGLSGNTAGFGSSLLGTSTGGGLGSLSGLGSMALLAEAAESDAAMSGLGDGDGDTTKAPTAGGAGGGAAAAGDDADMDMDGGSTPAAANSAAVAQALAGSMAPTWN